MKNITGIKYYSFFAIVFFGAVSYSQSTETLKIKLDKLQNAKGRIESTIIDINLKIEEVKLKLVHNDLVELGFPTSDLVIHHKALSIAYWEDYEQAKWVAHIISPEIINGSVHRTNDFRIDTLVRSGSSEELDFFVKSQNEEGQDIYDGFGYDRGHLAPSADFRWSRVALSESYYYSNMSPQFPEFNRGIWAELENQIRAYVSAHPKNQLHVVTGPIFEGEVSFIERSKNQVAIPDYFFKVILDKKRNSSVAFVLPHARNIHYPLDTYIVTVDELEKRTGYDFFPNIENDSCEAVVDARAWLKTTENGDVTPVSAVNLPKGHFNTVDAKIYMNDGSKVKVVGQVVSAKKTSKGNVMINLDKQFPNQIFTLFIKKEDLVNFTYDPAHFLKGKVIVARGKISSLGNTPTMFVNGEQQLNLFDQEKK
ncbi:MAG: DNA/RNA non-specific endonuclease [Crocinitomicaceae bacterium]|jgi:endonuclease G, mitochondrial|nr:DNA/RNA non-specific endonuclease [Crocinitomicaceae bacterium]